MTENKLPSTFSEYDMERDNIVILRVKPTSPPPPEGGFPPPPPPNDEEQEVPKNIEYPLDEEPPTPNDEDKKNDKGDKGDKGDEGDEGDEGEGDEGDEGEGDFGGTDEPEMSLEELMKKIQKEFESGNSAQQIQSQRDVEAIESALSTSKDRIKDTFKTKTVARAAIGNRKLFANDNEQRINDALNQIFN